MIVCVYKGVSSGQEGVAVKVHWESGSAEGLGGLCFALFVFYFFRCCVRECRGWFGRDGKGMSSE